MRFKENDVKKTVEMELVLVKSEKEKMARAIHDYELKRHAEDLERFKSEYQRQFKD